MKDNDAIRIHALKGRDFHKDKKKDPPPKTIRYCSFCKTKTTWIYHPLIGHSICQTCGLRKVPDVKIFLSPDNKIVEKQDNYK